MVICVTFGTNSARILQSAWIQTFSGEAFLVVGTFVVILTAEFIATILCVARIAGVTTTHRYVVRDIAGGILTTVARIDT